MKPLVTIITPTTGSDQLYDAVLSVENQTYDKIQHLVVADGKNHDVIENLLEGANRSTLINLPYNTGHSNYNGHRIYGAMTYIADGQYLCFLDQDNWFEPNHIQDLVNVINQGNDWAYSLRKIVDQDGTYICNDDCESLGNWSSILGDHFIDVNCYMIPKIAAIGFSPYWYRRARHPEEQPEVDRILSKFMMSNFAKFATNGDYTVNYRVASRKDSVQKGFFIAGNDKMKDMMKGEYPWRRKI